MVKVIALLLAQLLTAPIVSESVEIGGSGDVDLVTFECRDINRSTVLQRVCYDPAQRQLIVARGGVYERYCGVPAPTVEGLMGASSMGQFFNRNIRRQASGDRYACAAPRRT
ncbi:KTSC domain-containing protein [Bradyrhizobium guangdongense]|uniref:KTSC domain-containing protein n=1 Tax=Bradyrhizobium guangdongense TaxID=1325090 RepID=UPI00112E88B9|nr:KTSC domain-containing protein [Bradyrhizobium guangdongense]TPQ31515.1 KTSC domain-containing protein [Bradyrhizobium guangdongense]